jgi:antitoxin (DNA-binding transcriptional repressor) of toxin-antitoxin stability system
MEVKSMQTVTLADFQTRCLALLKQVEQGGESLLVIEDGHPVARIVPHGDVTIERRTEDLLATLRGSVQRYEAPEEPVSQNDWDALQC